MTSTYHAFADNNAWFARADVGHLFEGDRRYFNLQVDAVEQRTGDAVQVFLYLAGTAHAGLRRVVVVAAGTGVHAGYEHETGGVFHIALHTRDADLTVFQWLAEHFEDVTAELGQLVQEEDTVVCQADFAGLREASTSGHGDVGDGVVRVAERADGDEAAVLAQLAGHRVYFGCLEAFTQRKGRKDGGQALGQHGFATAGRTDKQHVVASGGGYFESALHVFLPLDVGEVEVECILPGIKFLPGVDYGGCQFLFAIEEFDHFP